MLTCADVCAGKELILCLSIVQCVFAITRQWWYVVERGIPLISRGIRQHRIKPPSNRLWAAIVRLPPEQVLNFLALMVQKYLFYCYRSINTDAKESSLIPRSSTVVSNTLASAAAF